MTIVRSLGATTLVALMSAHRTVAQRGKTAATFDQATIEAIQAYLQACTEPGEEAGTQATALPRSYS